MVTDLATNLIESLYHELEQYCDSVYHAVNLCVDIYREESDPMAIHHTNSQSCFIDGRGTATVVTTNDCDYNHFWKFLEFERPDTATDKLICFNNFMKMDQLMMSKELSNIVTNAVHYSIWTMRVLPIRSEDLSVNFGMYGNGCSKSNMEFLSNFNDDMENSYVTMDVSTSSMIILSQMPVTKSYSVDTIRVWNEHFKKNAQDGS